MSEQVSPLHDNILVKLDPLPEKRGGIVIPFDSQVNNVRTATVLARGRGKKVGHHRIPVGVEPGEKVAFFRWNMEHQTGKRISAFLEDLGENLALIKSGDILFAFPEGTNVEVV